MRGLWLSRVGKPALHHELPEAVVVGPGRRPSGSLGPLDGLLGPRLDGPAVVRLRHDGLCRDGLGRDGLRLPGGPGEAVAGGALVLRLLPDAGVVLMECLKAQRSSQGLGTTASDARLGQAKRKLCAICRYVRLSAACRRFIALHRQKAPCQGASCSTCM